MSSIREEKHDLLIQQFVDEATIVVPLIVRSSASARSG